ncbi:dihydroorotate dehydrogenase (quinone), mitochondrial isoform X2 [Procambarus clarkii]|uniref:dihydroorotate dehydrogenase (quinone), mitochondrial isoform X2 n=1 Tax=Procambarus clarkii TaxID=6728 RepID=UPI001E678CA5|nr:dihydroorotate dehydrogenase (quinone), mitochondrial-like isoform X2 [Procambarus clarkii]
MAFSKKIRDIIRVGIGGALTFGGISMYFQNEKFYDSWVIPLLHKLDPETAHNLAVKAAKYNLVREVKLKESKLLETRVLGLHFKTPIGLAAGFDKNGEAVEGLFKMGFSFVEVGSVTPLPQPGNPKPRVFRLTKDQGVINRYGFNSDGHEAVFEHLSHLPPPGHRKAILGVNLGKNKTSADHVQDYTLGVQKFGPIADYLVINVSSPNTPGLRNLQRKEELEKLISAVVTTRDALPGTHKPPVLLKIAPDISEDDKKNIASVVIRNGKRIDGMIVSNTTVTRPVWLQSQEREEVGGLSGQPLRSLATQTVKDMYLLTKGSVPIIGVGGVASGDDAYEKICAGASLIQLYTGLIYHGPSLVQKITSDLEDLLRRDGFKTVTEAVGVNCR